VKTLVATLVTTTDTRIRPTVSTMTTVLVDSSSAAESVTACAAPFTRSRKPIRPRHMLRAAAAPRRRAEGGGGFAALSSHQGLKSTGGGGGGRGADVGGRRGG
jgi:hypothetical protein